MTTKPEAMVEKRGLYLYITPVSGVYLGKGTNGEYRIDKVTLFSTQRFLRTRRFTFVYRKWREGATKCAAIKSSAVVAAVSAGGDPDTARRFAHGVIKEELNILASSRLGYTGRDQRGVVGIRGCMDSYDTNDLLLGQTIDLMQTSSQRHAPDKLRITGEFLQMPDQFFPFRRLLWLIRGNGRIQDKWRSILRSVAVLAGRSQNSIEVADAFLWNMIALEQLLLGEKETSSHLDKLTSRCQALFGYCPLWDRMGLGTALQRIYDVRCALVHEGDRNGVKLGHLITADLILANVIGCIVFNTSRIDSKGALRDLAEKARARTILGLDAREKGWHWHFSNLHYSENRFKKFWAL